MLLPLPTSSFSSMPEMDFWRAQLVFICLPCFTRNLNCVLEVSVAGYTHSPKEICWNQCQGMMPCALGTYPDLWKGETQRIFADFLSSLADAGPRIIFCPDYWELIKVIKSY